MIQKKVCLLGSFAVGKTSLISRYVNSLFSDKYLTTVGVKIDKKLVSLGNQQFSLMIWDIAGEDDFTNIRSAYFRGMNGYIVVIDGTRQQSFDIGVALHERVNQQLGPLPMVFAVNKVDLATQWQINAHHLESLQNTGYPVQTTSAKLDQGVNETFNALTQQWLVKHG